MILEREQSWEGHCHNCGKESTTRWKILDDDGDLIITICHDCLLNLQTAILNRE